MRFLKGHGTENDFVVLPDLAGDLDLTPELVARLCDRRAGLGADGVLRVVRSAAVGRGGAEFFLDHHNADGSRPEMCGNGIRVYAHYLVEAGLVPAGKVAIETRGGVKEVEVGPGWVVVDMGPATVGEPVQVDGVAATAVDMGNPHAVVLLPSLAGLGTLDPDRKDLNVEYVAPAGPAALQMRVHERGVGETRSCGTGACAAVVAHSLAAGTERGTAVEVAVPGGLLVVTWLAGGSVLLSGPAVLVAHGELHGDWLAAGCPSPPA